MNSDLPLASTLYRAVKKAAVVAIRCRQQGLQVEFKTDFIDGFPQESPVTGGERETQETLIQELAAVFPPHVRFIAEERLDAAALARLGSDVAQRIVTVGEWLESGMAGDVILIDPVDGTRGYANRNKDTINPWGMSCAYVQDGRTIACVIYEAALQECDAISEGHLTRVAENVINPCGSFYMAEQGHGAFERPEEGTPKKLGWKDSTQKGPLYLGRYPGDAKIETTPDNTQFRTEKRRPMDDQPCRRAIIEIADSRGYTDIRATMSIVAAVADVISGKAAGCSGAGYIWDHALYLLCAEAGIPVAVYSSIRDNRTVIIAAHDPDLFEAIEDRLLAEGDPSGAKAVVASPPPWRENRPERRGEFRSRSTPAKRFDK